MSMMHLLVKRRVLMILSREAMMPAMMLLEVLAMMMELVPLMYHPEVKNSVLGKEKTHRNEKNRCS